MLYPDYKFVEVAFGSVKNRNTVTDISELRSRFEASSKKECYRSLYRHCEAFKDYVSKNGSVKGWDGPVYADTLWFDIDDRGHLWRAAQNAQVLLLRLEKVYGLDPETLYIYFSGCKGFHIGIKAQLFGFYPCVEQPRYCQKIAQTLAADIKIDIGVYGRTRLFRIANSINGKTGKYKIPLTCEELNELTIGEIETLAASPRKLPKPAEAAEGILSGLLEAVKVEVEQPARQSYIPTLRKTALHGTKLCLWRIMHGVGEGTRDQSALRLAADYAKKGLPPELALSWLMTWNAHNQPPLDQTEVKAVVASAYGHTHYDFGCNDPILSSFCHEDCFLFKSKDLRKELPKAWRPSERWEETVNYIQHSQRIQVPCMGRINEAMRGVGRGEVLISLARPGVGKSLLAQTVIHDVCMKQNMRGIFFSLEMPADLLLVRAASIESGWSSHIVEDKIKDDDYDDLTEKIEALDRNVLFVDKGGLSISEIQQIVELTGDVSVVVIDYLSLVRAPGNSLYERVTYVSRQLKELAKNANVAVVMLSQVSRAGGDGTDPIKLHHGRDSGAIEEGADFVVGMWREAAMDDSIVVQLLKNRRDGGLRTEYMTFVGDSARLGLQRREDSEIER